MRVHRFKQATPSRDSLLATACSSCRRGIRSWRIFFPRIPEESRAARGLAQSNKRANVGQSEPTKSGAGDGNRTHGSSLGSLGITIIRRPLKAQTSRQKEILVAFRAHRQIACRMKEGRPAAPFPTHISHDELA